MANWIDRREQEPTEAGEYICYAYLDGIHVINVYDWFPSRGHFSSETRYGHYVTHWQPLPEPPQE